MLRCLFTVFKFVKIQILQHSLKLFKQDNDLQHFSPWRIDNKWHLGVLNGSLISLENPDPEKEEVFEYLSAKNRNWKSETTFELKHETYLMNILDSMKCLFILSLQKRSRFLYDVELRHTFCFFLNFCSNLFLSLKCLNDRFGSWRKNCLALKLVCWT